MPQQVPLNAQLLYEARATLGEGPVWDRKKQCLYWVDIEGRSLHSHDTLRGSNTSWNFEEMPGAVFPVDDGRLLLAMEKGFALFDPVTTKLVP